MGAESNGILQQSYLYGANRQNMWKKSYCSDFNCHQSATVHIPEVHADQHTLLCWERTQWFQSGDCTSVPLSQYNAS
jgi:hypothetical protein